MPVPHSLLRLVILAPILALAACSTSGPTPRPVVEASPQVRPGDVVRVAVWREEDLTGEFSVDDRGIVTLPLLGDRDVAGLTREALRDTLVGQYREYLRNPSIEVSILRRVNILGAVNDPGLYPVDATISLADALGLAGGVAPNGDPDDVMLARGGEVVYDDLDQDALLADIDIQSGDRIVVSQKSWLERNPGALVGSLIATATALTITLIRQ